MEKCKYKNSNTHLWQWEAFLLFMWEKKNRFFFPFFLSLHPLGSLLSCALLDTFKFFSNKEHPHPHQKGQRSCIMEEAGGGGAPHNVGDSSRGGPSMGAVWRVAGCQPVRWPHYWMHVLPEASVRPASRRVGRCFFPACVIKGHKKNLFFFSSTLPLLLWGVRGC